MFNELSLVQVNSILAARSILETFVKSSIKAKEFGFTEIRLHENSLQNMYQLSLFENYRIDNWLKDKEVNSDLQDRFREIITSSPLISKEDIVDIELFERSEFYKTIDITQYNAFGLGAAYVYGTLANSLNTHQEWLKSFVNIQHYSISNDEIENTCEVEILHFSSDKILETHLPWIENEQKESLRKSIDLWIKKEEYFPNILFGVDVEIQLKRIGLSKKFDQIFLCFKKLDAYAKTWNEGGFSLNDLKSQTLMDVSGESETTMNKFSVERKFRLSNGIKEQFEFHAKFLDMRIYFLPNEKTHNITVGYVGKHLRTSLYC